MLKQLKSCSDVKEGDYFHTINPLTNKPCLAVVNKVWAKDDYFEYSGKSFKGLVSNYGLKETILLRKTETGLEILAGEDAFQKLLPKKPLDKELIAALARLCLKKGDEFSCFDDT
jgi:hypothetical protein